MKLIFASNNLHKIEEILKECPPNYEIISMKEAGIDIEIIEDGVTMIKNAHIKATKIYELIQLSCFSDDSGLEVEALGGAPGVYSARYSGEGATNQSNNTKLLEALQGEVNRNAQFKSVICLIHHNQTNFFEGILKGKIAEGLSGKEGFGYDPLFIPDGYLKTLAEFTMEEKNAISHRGIALRKMVEYLEGLG